MGYTNYIESTRTLTGSEWFKFQGIAHYILSENKDIVGNSLGDPIESIDECFTPNSIAFNGLGDDSYETCSFNKNYVGFNFCKTARKPYDKLVLACYLAFEEIHGGFIVSSDGEDDDNFGVEAKGILERAKKLHESAL